MPLTLAKDDIALLACINDVQNRAAIEGLRIMSKSGTTDLDLVSNSEALNGLHIAVKILEVALDALQTRTERFESTIIEPRI